jgi:hypothetical protein
LGNAYVIGSDTSTGQVYVSKVQQSNGSVSWTDSIVTNTGGWYANEPAIDSSGNVFLTGTYAGKVDFDPGPDTYYLTSLGTIITKKSSVTPHNAFVEKLDTNGRFVWAGSMGTDVGAGGQGIALDGVGDLYLTGWWSPTSTTLNDFDPSAGTYALPSQGQSATYIVKIDTNLNFQWAEKLGGAVNQLSDDANIDVADSSGLYFAGSFKGTVDFDPGPGVYNLSSIPSTYANTYAEKLDSAGNFVWAGSFSGGTNAAHALAKDAAGNLYTVGTFANTMDFDPTAGRYNLTSSNDPSGTLYDLYVSKLTQSTSSAPSSGPSGTATNARIAPVGVQPAVQARDLHFGGFVDSLLIEALTTDHNHHSANA